MYLYNETDTNLLETRAAQFKHQVERRITGSLNEDEFRPLRLMNGLYLEMHAYMQRIAIPYGVLNSEQLHALADVTEKYDKAYGHFTTRQNIQLNWLDLEQVPEILEVLARVNMHAIQTSGNCIRSITSDPYAGAAIDELADPRPTAELIRQWSTLHPEFAYLGRKFKIAVTGAAEDRAAIQVHDIGVQLVQSANGEPGYKLYIGGGLGRTPMVGKVIKEFLPEDDLLAYLEASLRIYNLYGRRDNKYKARIKILTKELGVDVLREKIDAEFHQAYARLPATSGWLKTIETQFRLPDFKVNDSDALIQPVSVTEPEFKHWLTNNVLPHKQPGYRIVNISTKPIGGVPGDVSSAQMRVLANLAERFSHDEIRVTKDQNLVLPHARFNDLYTIWQQLVANNLGTSNHRLISDIVSCPGMDYCSLATARSIPVAQAISERFANTEFEREIGHLSIKISGCINACGHHHIGHIGILGLEKNGKEYYQIVLGGNGNERATIGRVSGPGFASEDIVGVIDKLLKFYLQVRETNELFPDTYKRLGLKAFKEVIYASH